jgi:hypothetical protein
MKQLCLLLLLLLALPLSQRRQQDLRQLLLLCVRLLLLLRATLLLLPAWQHPTLLHAGEARVPGCWGAWHASAVNTSTSTTSSLTTKHEAL